MELRKVRRDFSLRVLNKFRDLLRDGFSDEMGIKGVWIFGTFGVLDGDESSDLDVIIVAEDRVVRDINLSNKIIEAEWNLRKGLADGDGLEILCRHFASLFTEVEFEVYRECLWMRMGVPWNNHEYWEVFPGVFSSLVAPNSRYQEADVVVSFEEYLENWERVSKLIDQPYLSRKWVERMVRDLQYLKKRERSVGQVLLEKKLTTEYENDDLLMREIQLELNRLKKEQHASDLEIHRLLHQLAWTLEKTRWEFLLSWESSDYFEKYRRKEIQGYGFNLDQLCQLIRKTDEFLGMVNNEISKELLDEINEVRELGGLERLAGVYSKFPNWWDKRVKELLFREGMNKR